jgi:FKBP-type peptidyl-prolyl cis-trans isomerase
MGVCFDVDIFNLGMDDELKTPAPSQPKKHRSFTVEFKVGVIEWVEFHSSSVRGAAIHFGLDRKVVRTWLSQKQALR